jgi:hypothetical protein
MATIRVPGPPPQAFQKNRPISDLIRAQIKHFQHLEHKLKINLATKFSPHDLTTEAAAARYIAEMTNALCTQNPSAQQAPTPISAVSAKPKASSAAKSTPKSRGIPLAASATTEARAKKSTSARPAKKRS